MKDADAEAREDRAGAEPRTPKGKIRKEHIIATARKHFFERGYEATSVNDIVKESRGSMATLYQLFENKQKLFVAVIRQGADEMVRPMEAAGNLPIAEGLQVIGEAYLARVLNEGGLAIFRMMVGESRKFPDVFDKLTLEGPMRVRDTLAAYLRQRQEAGEIQCEDPEFAGQAFLDMLRSRFREMAAMDPAMLPTPEAQKDHVARVIALFLRGVAAR
jgi:AcrR family transcriptional regulator